jgi:hypothetical protein
MLPRGRLMAYLRHLHSRYLIVIHLDLGRRSGHASTLAATSGFNVKEFASCMVQWSSINLKRRGHVSSLAATSGLDVKEFASCMVHNYDEVVDDGMWETHDGRVQGVEGDLFYIS